MYSVDECNNHKADPGSLPDKPHQARRSNHSVSTNKIPNQVISTAGVQWFKSLLCGFLLRGFYLFDRSPWCLYHVTGLGVMSLAC